MRQKNVPEKFTSPSASLLFISFSIRHEKHFSVPTRAGAKTSRSDQRISPKAQESLLRPPGLEKSADRPERQVRWAPENRRLFCSRQSCAKRRSVVPRRLVATYRGYHAVPST